MCVCIGLFEKNLFILVAPDVLHRHVKSISDSVAKNLHFQAPEIDTGLVINS